MCAAMNGTYVRTQCAIFLYWNWSAAIPAHIFNNNFPRKPVEIIESLTLTPCDNVNIIKFRVITHLEKLRNNNVCAMIYGGRNKQTIRQVLSLCARTDNFPIFQFDFSAGFSFHVEWLRAGLCELAYVMKCGGKSFPPFIEKQNPPRP